MIVLIGLQVLLGLVGVEPIFLQHHDDSHINGNSIDSYLETVASSEAESSALSLRDDLSEPFVLSNVINGKSLGWVNCQNPFNEISTFWTHKFRNAEISIQNLLIERSSIWIFERQISTDHSKENNPTAPHIHIDSFITFACNHFRSGIAGRATSCL